VDSNADGFKVWCSAAKIIVDIDGGLDAYTGGAVHLDEVANDSSEDLA